MKLIKVDFHNVDDDGLVRSRLDCANVPLFVYDMVLAYNADRDSCVAQVVEIHGDRVKIAIDPAMDNSGLVPA